MTIRNPDAYMAGVWDWGIVRECFGDTAIKPTDIDGMVERHGNFLILETKQPGVMIPKGQQITFDALIKKGFTIFVIWGSQNNPESMRVMYPNGTVKNVPICDQEILRDYTKRWFKWANER